MLVRMQGRSSRLRIFCHPILHICSFLPYWLLLGLLILLLYRSRTKSATNHDDKAELSEESEGRIMAIGIRQEAGSGAASTAYARQLSSEHCSSLQFIDFVHHGQQPY
jgi:hypothetical protein